VHIKVFQPNIRAYREFFFSSLNEAFEKCLVIHGGVDESSFDVCYKAIKISPKIIGGFNLQFNLSRFALQSGVNIVGLDLHWPSPIFWGIIAKLRGVPLIFWGHGFGKSWLAKFLKLFLIKIADALVLYGDNGKEEMLAFGVPCEKVFVAPNTVRILNSEDCSSNKKSIFLYVGRLQERKRLDFLLHAFARLPIQAKSARLVFIGDGSIKASLVGLSKALKIDDRVEFISGTSDENVLKSYFSKAIAYVTPSACGLGLLHAFAYGVPVITCFSNEHGPEIEWLSDGVNGFMIPFSEEMCKDKMLLLYTNNIVSSELGKNAYKTYLEASPERMVEVFKSVINLVSSKT